jgi:phosphomannomutase
MLEREIVMGGEESGGIGFQRHLPERDGLLNALLLANVMAEEGKTWASWSPICRPSTASTSTAASTCTSPDDVKNGAIARARALKTGEPGLCRNADPAPGESRRREVLSRQPRSQATKPNAAETWLLLRASGTEPLMRIYTESCSKESVAKLLESARSCVVRVPCAGSSVHQSSPSVSRLDGARRFSVR